MMLVEQNDFFYRADMDGKTGFINCCYEYILAYIKNYVQQEDKTIEMQTTATTKKLESKDINYQRTAITRSSGSSSSFTAAAFFDTLLYTQ